MPDTHELLSGKKLTLDEATQDRRDILHELDQRVMRDQFVTDLEHGTERIRNEVQYQLCLGRPRVVVAPRTEWKWGRHNVNIPVNLNPPELGQVFFRVPLPYRVGGHENADEKLRCEVATYIKLRERCPTLPIPLLRGFAFANGRTFLAPENGETGMPCFKCCTPRKRQDNGSSQCRFVAVDRPTFFAVGYMIISSIQGQSLGESWHSAILDDRQRRNLFNGFADIMMSLSDMAPDRIGSWTINNDGEISLTNRPLTPELLELDHQEIDTIGRRTTYNAVELYVHDLLKCHDNRIKRLPNVILNRGDGVHQLAYLATMRSLIPNHFDERYRHGPFVFMLNDIDLHNIFVDNDWNITGLIDLECACSLPVQMQLPPRWLADVWSSESEAETIVASFDRYVTEFMQAFQDRFNAVSANYDVNYSQIMDEAWTSGSFWYVRALHDPSRLQRLFKGHIRGKYRKAYLELDNEEQEHVWAFMSHFSWCIGADKFVEKKLKQRHKYMYRLVRAYGKDPIALGGAHNEDDIDVPLASDELYDPNRSSSCSEDTAHNVIDKMTIGGSKYARISPWTIWRRRREREDSGT